MAHTATAAQAQHYDIEPHGTCTCMHVTPALHTARGDAGANQHNFALPCAMQNAAGLLASKDKRKEVWQSRQLSAQSKKKTESAEEEGPSQEPVTTCIIYNMRVINISVALIPSFKGDHRE